VTFDQLWERLVGLRRATTSQRKMAMLMDTSQSHVSEMESDVLGRKDGPGIEILERYANALGYVIRYDLVTPEELEP
jgi:transcriptional regulator with XRE-family HTH domain